MFKNSKRAKEHVKNIRSVCSMVKNMIDKKTVPPDEVVVSFLALIVMETERFAKDNNLEDDKWPEPAEVATRLVSMLPEPVRDIVSNLHFVEAGKDNDRPNEVETEDNLSRGYL